MKEQLEQVDLLGALEEMADANFHRGGMRVFHIGELDSSVFSDLRRSARMIWDLRTSSKVTNGHVTGWTQPMGDVEQWSLFNMHGDTSRTSEDFNYRREGKRYVSPVFEILECFKPQNLRLNVLGSNSSLGHHEEHTPFPRGNNEVYLRGRFHIPLITSRFAKMMADGEIYSFLSGHMYYFNNGCVHSATNLGFPRAHLVFDSLLSEKVMGATFGGSSPGWLDTANRGPVAPRGDIDIGEYATQPGMSEEDFRARELVFA